MLSSRKLTLLSGLGLFMSATAPQASTFHITMDFSGGGLSDIQQSYFTAAADFWSSIITGYNSKVTSSLVTGVTISASATAIDGVGKVLGSAGPNTSWNGFGLGGYVLAKTGVMNFDTADVSNMISNGSFTSVIEHEMAHVLGFGTLWTNNHLYTTGTGKYTGQYGLAAYNAEFGKSGTYVPVELGGGVGTADGHWDEVDNGSTNTGIVDASGRDMKSELMTGWLNSPVFVSNTTKQSFRDLGYTVASVTAVPLPATLWLFTTALLSVAGFSAKKRSV